MALDLGDEILCAGWAPVGEGARAPAVRVGGEGVARLDGGLEAGPDRIVVLGRGRPDMDSGNQGSSAAVWITLPSKP